jgi:transketolase
MRNTFIATLSEIAAENPKVWLLCGDLGFSVLEPFAARFPERYVNMGVAEQNMAGVAAGIALSGNTVFIYSIGNFPTLRCLEQIRNDVCYHRADVKVVAVGAGFAYGSQGYTHHAIEDVAIMGALPGMNVYTPCDPNDVRVATRHIAANGVPSYLRLSRAGEPNLGSDSGALFRAYRELRPGREVVLVASGPIAAAALAAADLLVSRGHQARVIAVATLKPLPDAELDEITKGAALVVTIEEHILRGGLHAAVAARLAATRGSRPRLLGLGIPEPSKISRAGDRDVLLAEAGLAPEAIAERITSALAEH